MPRPRRRSSSRSCWRAGGRRLWPGRRGWWGGWPVYWPRWWHRLLSLGGLVAVRQAASFLRGGVGVRNRRSLIVRRWYFFNESRALKYRITSTAAATAAIRTTSPAGGAGLFVAHHAKKARPRATAVFE